MFCSKTMGLGCNIMIDRFDRQTFEDALPKLPDGTKLWVHVGMVGREHCYTIQVKPGILIHIRSSVLQDGFAAAAAKDSIRAWLARDAIGSPLGSKAGRWVTRVPGWADRLRETLRTLWRMGSKITPCPYCQQLQIVIKVKHGKPENIGRWVLRCGNKKCRLSKEFGQWITEPILKKESKQNDGKGTREVVTVVAA